MSGFVEIGHAIVHCPRCGTPRHVPVTARCVPVADRTTLAVTFRARLHGEQVGEVHVQIKHLPDGHRCGKRPPVAQLRVVESGDQTGAQK